MYVIAFRHSLIRDSHRIYDGTYINYVSSHHIHILLQSMFSLKHKIHQWIWQIHEKNTYSVYK